METVCNQTGRSLQVRGQSGLHCELRLKSNKKSLRRQDERDEAVAPGKPAERNLRLLWARRFRVSRKHFRSSGAAVLEVSIQVPVAGRGRAGSGRSCRPLRLPRPRRKVNLGWAVCVPRRRGPRLGQSSGSARPGPSLPSARWSRHGSSGVPRPAV